MTLYNGMTFDSMMGRTVTLKADADPESLVKADDYLGAQPGDRLEVQHAWIEQVNGEREVVLLAVKRSLSWGDLYADVYADDCTFV